MPQLPNYAAIPPALDGSELGPVKGLWSLIVPEATTNYFLDPSFEASAAPTFTQTNCTATRINTWQTRGLYGIQIAPSSAVVSSITYSAINPTTVGLPASTLCTWSLYVKAAGGENFTLTATINGASFSKTFKASGDTDRVSLSFMTPSSVGTTSSFKLQKDSATTKPYFTDAWQLEPKGYPTLYVDGDQSNGTWNGIQYASTSNRDAFAPYGRALNFKDLGFKIVAFQGGGMPPLENLSTPFALLGGDAYQRTVIKKRVLTLVGIVEGATPVVLARVRQQLTSYFAPNIATQTAAPLYLSFQPLDACGNPIGKALDVPVNYVGGLEGNFTNPVQETLTLQFVEYLPPSFRETLDISNDLNYQTSYAAGTAGNLWRQAVDGSWNVTTLVDATLHRSSFYDTNGQFWYCNPGVNIVGAATKVITGGDVYAWASDQSGRSYIGGDFTGTINYLMQYDGSTFNSIASAPNGAVYALLRTGSYLVVGGAFTTPQNAITRYYTVGTPASAGFVNTVAGGNVYALCLGLDGRTIYVSGSFTTAAGNPAAGIAATYTDSSVWTPLSTSTSGIVYALATGKDGAIYAAGSFTSIGGVTANRIAKWNGSIWQPLGAGLGTASDYVNSLLVHPDTGELYAAGNFFTTGDGIACAGAARWNGSSWIPLDVFFAPAGAYVNHLVISPVNKELALSMLGGAITGLDGSLTPHITTINYAGTAPERPLITMHGQAGLLRSIVNFTTKKQLNFNYKFQVSEIAQLSLDPNNFYFTSNTSGNVIGKILPGSDLGSFCLVPGANRIGVFWSAIGGGNIAVTTFTYRNRHFGLDGSISL